MTTRRRLPHIRDYGGQQCPAPDKSAQSDRPAPTGTHSAAAMLLPHRRCTGREIPTTQVRRAGLNTAIKWAAQLTMTIALLSYRYSRAGLWLRLLVASRCLDLVSTTQDGVFVK